MSDSLKKYLLISGALVLMVVHVILGTISIKAQSPTYDEPVHLTAGLSYLKTGDFRFNGHHHPAFAEMWASLPLLFLKPLFPYQHPYWLHQNWSPQEQYEFADMVLYHNRVSPDKLMESGRFMMLLLSVLFGVAFFVAIYFTAGVQAAFIGFCFWALSPDILAHGTLVTTDFAFMGFFFFFFFTLTLKRTMRNNFLTGLMLGFCLASKYLALALVPCLLGCWIFIFLKNKFKESQGNSLGLEEFKKIMTGAVVVVGAAFLVLLVVYRGSSLDVWWEGFSAIFQRSQAGRTSFFRGTYSNTGWLMYFPFSFLVKTPLPTLLALFFAILALVSSKKGISPYMILPPLLFFVLACLSKVQIGHRHILVIYPFLFYLIGVGLDLHPRKELLMFPFLIWLGVELSMTHPYYLSFFNEPAHGPDHGYTYFTDSNVDWGQGLKKLSQELTARDKEKGIYLSYFGVGEPHAYGLRYIGVGSCDLPTHQDDHTDPHLSPEKFALSVTNYQATYYSNREVFSWLKDKKPWKMVAHSILIYDFKDDPDALAILKSLNWLQFGK